MGQRINILHGRLQRRHGHGFPTARSTAKSATLRALVAMFPLLGALVMGTNAAEAAPGGEVLLRDGPADGPTAKPKRIPASNDTSRLADYWDESPRITTPGVGDVVPGQYLVVFQPGTPGAKDLAQTLTRDVGGELTHTYEHALPGFAARISEDQVEKLLRHPNVVSVEPDRVIGAAAGADTWGLDRLDQADLPLDNNYDAGNGGAGVHVYVIDSGIAGWHRAFSGRMGNGYDAITPGGNAGDCNGHGTHVAGIIGGTVYGVAPRVTLHPVRVLDCSAKGSLASLIAGADWVMGNGVHPMVVNLSITTDNVPPAGAVADAVRNLEVNRVTTVAAGNGGCDCEPWLAQSDSAIVVGATTNTDNRADYSNFGVGVDLYAPGSNITSAWVRDAADSMPLSGTSMAAASVAGVAARYLSAKPADSWNNDWVKDHIVLGAVQNRIHNLPLDFFNRLLNTQFLSGTTPPPPATGVLNGGFESGQTGWIQQSSAGYNLITGRMWHWGLYSFWGGGYNAAKESVSQSISVPTEGKLRYWWRMSSTEATGSGYDSMQVRLYNATTGTFLTTLRTFTSASARDVWQADTISLAAWGGQTVRLQFYVATDSALASSFFVDDVDFEKPATLPPTPKWQNWASLGSPEGGLAGSPDLAAYKYPCGGSTCQGLESFARGNDNRLWHKMFRSQYGEWESWSPLGEPPGGFSSDPGAVKWDEKVLASVFVTGKDGNLWQKWYGNDPWVSLGAPPGGIAGSPDAASWGPGRIDVLVRGKDGNLWQKVYNQGWQTTWYSLGTPPGGFSFDPGAVSWGPSRLDIFVRGNDGKLWQRAFSNTWQPWYSLGAPAGGIAGSPDVASWGPSRLDIFVRGTDGNIAQLTYTQYGWSVWGPRDPAGNMLSLGVPPGGFSSDPSAGSNASERLDLVVRGNDGNLWWKWYGSS